MRVHQRKLTESHKKVIEASLDTLDQEKQGREGRVCGSHCTMICSSCGAMNCQCHCDAACPSIPAHLSSDPERYPIEGAIAPLVFEMKRLGVVEPCWSCEGHNGLDGELWKRPAIWFYCDDVIHLRLLADVVETLHMSKKLTFRWHVLLTYSDTDCPDTVFALEPERRRIENVKLEDMRADIQVLSENLYDMVHEYARQLRSIL